MVVARFGGPHQATREQQRSNKSPPLFRRRPSVKPVKLLHFIIIKPVAQKIAVIKINILFYPGCKLTKD
jgi:hypothetical protein